MPKYVALLRGIGPMNPNMRNEKLRGMCEDLGFSNVATVISSGNVLFETPRTDVAALEALLEKAWPEQLGFTSTVKKPPWQSLFSISPLLWLRFPKVGAMQFWVCAGTQFVASLI